MTSLQNLLETAVAEGAAPGWGFGGSVAPDGRYGWVGGTGTTANVAPATGTVGILFTQMQLAGRASVPLMREFWDYAFSEANA